MKSIDDVRSSQLCCGCGACAYICPTVFQIEDMASEGRRPIRQSADVSNVETNHAEAEAFDVCPGASLEHTFDRSANDLNRSLVDGWGPVVALWEGRASDSEINFRGSSGGAITALAAYMLERGGVSGVLHTAHQPDNPILNRTVFSTTRRELVEAAGSRYSPASPCERLDLIENADRPAVFIGKPCDVAAVFKARRIRPALDRNVALTIALFCAGTPSTNGTKALLLAMGLDADESLKGFRYRGHGWPGNATAERHSGEVRQLTYAESWGAILTRHVQWRCRLCIDHTGEFADIAIGDPWYREPNGIELGDSLIVARTALGKRVVEEAIRAGFLVAKETGPEILIRSQPNLLRTRGAVWGRLMACRALWRSIPRYRGLPTFRFWLSELSARQKAQSVFGTMRRLIWPKRRR